VAGLRFQLNDLSPAMQAQVQKQLGPQVSSTSGGPAKSKHGQKRVVDLETGEIVDSKREAKALALYRQQLRDKQFSALATQVWFQIEGAIYRADFVKIEVVSANKDGTVNAKLRVIDAKGFKTKEYQHKKRQMLERFGITIEEV
jgi:hypothetical protein